MDVVLWDTRHGGAYKDFAGGFGVGTFRGQSWRAKIIEAQYRGDYRSPPLAFGYLAAQLRAKGHDVRYALDEFPQADVYIFNPALMTLPYERQQMRVIAERFPQARLLVVGQVASTMPEEFDGVPVTVLNGEPEQLGVLWETVLETPLERQVIGTVKTLDDLPFPDWAPFPHAKFRVTYDFWKFPTGYIQSSRGCALSCSYCPYIILENKVRARSPESVGAELRQQIERFGFQSFKFRDPLFGTKKKQIEGIVDEIGRLPRKIQFSVESRIEILTYDVVKMLSEVGLTSVTVGIETPSVDTLKKYKRAPIKDDKQNAFVDMCRGLGVRVVSGFMIGFPEDTRETVRQVLRYAKQVNPFAANFNICTPYPGTHWMTEVSDQVASRDWSRYDVYTPNMKYQHLTTDEVTALHEKCFTQYYFRWDYLKANWRFLLPGVSALFPAKVAPEAVVGAETKAKIPAPHLGAMLPVITNESAAGASCSNHE